jgi:hypothetical protein
LSGVDATNGKQWLRTTAVNFRERFLETVSEVDLHALMGVLAGSLADRTTMGREGLPDVRAHPGLDGLRRFVDEVRHGRRDAPTLEPGACDVDVLRDNA